MPPTEAHPRLMNATSSIWRCGDVAAAFPLMSGIGAALYPGRWNLATSPVIYAAEHFSTALLEKLTSLNGELPAAMHGLQIIVPKGVSIEHFNSGGHPGWQADESATRTFGNLWFQERRSLLLRVPSVAAALVDHNILINPSHHEFASLQDRTPFPIAWDERLFGTRTG